MKLLAVGGGSGGHVTPIVAVLHELVKRDGELTVHFVCDRAFEAQARGIMAHASVPVETTIIAAGKLRRYKHFKPWHYVRHPSIMLRNLLDGLKIAVGFLQSIVLLLRTRPDVVFAKGGYVCLPLGLAARLLRIPLVIHDSDARPGLTNRVLAPHATAIATGYPLENYPYDTTITTYTGVPIKASFRPVTEAEMMAAKRQFSLPPAKSLVVAIGGGLGAKAINDAMVEAAPKLAEQGAQAYIVAGKKHGHAVREAARHYHNVTVVDFISEGLETLFTAADIVVTRASATSLQELSGMKKPVITVPAEALGDQHQNAAVYAAADAAIVMQDSDVAAPGRLGRQLTALLADEKRQAELATHIHQFARPHAARDVAHLILAAASEEKQGSLLQ